MIQFPLYLPDPQTGKTKWENEFDDEMIYEKPFP